MKSGKVLLQGAWFVAGGGLPSETPQKTYKLNVLREGQHTKTNLLTEKTVLQSDNVSRTPRNEILDKAQPIKNDLRR